MWPLAKKIASGRRIDVGLRKATDMPKSARPTRHRDRWRIRWHDHTGQRRSKVFATYDEADREPADTPFCVKRRPTRMSNPAAFFYVQVCAKWLAAES